jgi:quinolinate synthase
MHRLEAVEEQHVRSADELLARFGALDQPETYSAEECGRIEALVAEIQELKEREDAIILAHNYQRPEIFEVADFVGDSLELAKRGRDVTQSTIVFCGVHFMAETAKILAPDKRVLIPDSNAGCSLAESADADELVARRDELREIYPDIKIVSYVNTTAEVKAVTDVCCTSSNALEIVEKIDTRNILFVPDENLASWVSKNTDKHIIAWNGNCYVHHQIRPEEIRRMRDARPNLKVVVHPECRDDVLKEADEVLSTSGMIRYATESDSQEFLIVTECGLSDRLLMEVPEKTFYKVCQLCKYMKMITLEGTRDALLTGCDEVELSREVCDTARGSLERMFALS